MIKYKTKQNCKTITKSGITILWNYFIFLNIILINAAFSLMEEEFKP